jgi:hypothetical protein
VRNQDVENLKATLALVTRLASFALALVLSTPSTAQTEKGAGGFDPPERWVPVVVTVNPEAKCVDRAGSPTGEPPPSGRNVTAQQNPYGIIRINARCFMFQRDVTYPTRPPIPSPLPSDNPPGVAGTPLGQGKSKNR